MNKTQWERPNWEEATKLVRACCRLKTLDTIGAKTSSVGRSTGRKSIFLTQKIFLGTCLAGLWHLRCRGPGSCRRQHGRDGRIHRTCGQKHALHSVHMLALCQVAYGTDTDVFACQKDIV